MVELYLTTISIEPLDITAPLYEELCGEAGGIHKKRSPFQLRGYLTERR